MNDETGVRQKKKNCPYGSLEVQGEMLWPYQVIGGPCLGLPEELQVVLTGDVLQQGLSGGAMALAVLLTDRRGVF